MRPAGRRGRVQHRPRRRDPRRARRRPGRDRQPLLLVEPADDPHGGPRHQGRRGRLLHRRRRRDRQPLRQRRQRHGAERDLQAGRRAHRGAFAGRAGAVDAAGGPARHLHRDGPDRRERGARSRTSPARRWTSSPRSASNAPSPTSRTASSPTRSPRSRCPTAPGVDRRRAAGRHDGRGAGQPQAGVPPRRPDHRRQRLPAQRRRRGGARDERHEGGGARPHAAGPHRVVRRLRRSTPRSWASARSRPAARRSSGPA